MHFDVKAHKLFFFKLSVLIKCYLLFLVDTDVKKHQTAFVEKKEEDIKTDSQHEGKEELMQEPKKSNDLRSTEDQKEIWIPPSREKSELSTTTTTTTTTTESSDSSNPSQTDSEQHQLRVELPALATAGATAAPADENSEPSVYHIKWNTFDLRDVPVITQNENGPCPLLAIMNILLLKGKVKLEPGLEIITPEQIMTYLGDCILENAPKVYISMILSCLI